MLLPMLLACLIMAAAPGYVKSQPDKDTSADLKSIHVTGLFPISDEEEAGELGRGVLPAVELALDHVKANQDVLKGYELVTTINDTKVRGIFFHNNN